MGEARGGGLGEGVLREDLAGEQRAHERADAPEDEGDEALRSAADTLIGLLIDVELARDEQEVVAGAVQQDRGEDQRGLRRAAAATSPTSTTSSTG